jgi:hypothetical protein
MLRLWRKRARLGIDHIYCSKAAGAYGPRNRRSEKSPRPGSIRNRVSDGSDRYSFRAALSLVARKSVRLEKEALCRLRSQSQKELNFGNDFKCSAPESRSVASGTIARSTSVDCHRCDYAVMCEREPEILQQI